MPDQTGALQTPTAAASPVTAPQTVTIPLEQLNAFTSMQARLAKIEEERQAAAAEAKRIEAETLAAKGQLEKALQDLRKQSEDAVNAERARLAQTEERAQRYALDGELSRVLSGQNLVPGGADQLTQLWRGQFIVEPQGDSFHVRTPTFQSVQDFVAAQLAKPEYAHFVRAQGYGGAGAGGGTTAPTSPANPAPASEPKTLGEAAIMEVMARQNAPQNDPRANMRVPFGLKRVS
jgi:hypothetical protein